MPLFTKFRNWSGLVVPGTPFSLAEMIWNNPGVIGPVVRDGGVEDESKWHVVLTLPHGETQCLVRHEKQRTP